MGNKAIYDIHDLHQDLNSIYSDYDRGKIDKKLVTETAFNICQAFVKDNQPKGSKECPTCQGDGAIYEKRNLATRDK